MLEERLRQMFQDKVAGLREPEDAWASIEKSRRRYGPLAFASGILLPVMVLGMVTVSLVGLWFAFGLGSEPRPQSRDSGSVSDLEPQATATVRVDGFPGAVAVGDQGVWVTLSGSGDSRADSVQEISSASAEVVTSMVVPSVRSAIVANADAVWCLRVDSFPGAQGDYSDFQGVLTRLRPDTGEVVDSIPLGGGFPYAIAATDDDVWVSQVTGESQGMISRVDSRSNQVIARIPLSQRPYELAVNDDAVWVLASSGESRADLLRISTSTNEVIMALEVGAQPGGVVTGASSVWASKRDAIIQVDAASNAISKENVGPVIQVFGVGAGGVWYLGTDPVTGSPEVRRLNSSGRVDESLTLDKESDPVDAALDPDRGLIWIANNNGSVTRIEL